MNDEKEKALYFKKHFRINKVTFKERTHLNEIPIQIEFNHFVRGKSNFIYSNGLISKEEGKPEKNEINDILIEKIGVYIRQKMKDKLQKEMSIKFGKLNSFGLVYYANINFVISGEIKGEMLFEKIPTQVNITLIKDFEQEGEIIDRFAYLKVISIILESLISEEEHIFLLNTSKKLQKQFKKIVADVVLTKFKKTREYKIRCLYDKEFENHFRNNGRK